MDNKQAILGNGKNLAMCLQVASKMGLFEKLTVISLPQGEVISPALAALPNVYAFPELYERLTANIPDDSANGFTTSVANALTASISKSGVEGDNIVIVVYHDIERPSAGFYYSDPECQERTPTIMAFLTQQYIKKESAEYRIPRRKEQGSERLMAEEQLVHYLSNM